MERRKVAGWNVPAPTSISSGCNTTQPLLAQKFCSARISPWKVFTSGVALFSELFDTVFYPILGQLRTIVISLSGCVKNVLNRSFITYKLPLSVHFCLAREQNPCSYEAVFYINYCRLMRAGHKRAALYPIFQGLSAPRR